VAHSRSEPGTLPVLSSFRERHLPLRFSLLLGILLNPQQQLAFSYITLLGSGSMHLQYISQLNMAKTAFFLSGYEIRVAKGALLV
jgi:hypothetical protein